MKLSPLVCTPLATKRPGDSLAAPAAAGQGVCTSQRLRLHLASSAALRASRSMASRSSAFSFLSLFRMKSLAVPIATTAKSTAANTISAGETSMGMEVFLWFGVMFSACLLAVVIFHWVIVPLFDWIERRFFA
ncbi:hypothetical protein LJR129_001180 [Acidovorax sp. LjRoot129]|uniref:hypothetical protein n=1 Tax=Acidovorax sp. LjRoot129 TaxID=3342260 RepID=UPI003ECC7998